MTITPELPVTPAARPKKRMMSVEWELDPVLCTKKRPVVFINYSSLELLQTCKRKAMYVLKQELKSTEESPALSFGSGIHKGLEVWYTLPREHRKSSCDECCTERCANCSAVASFLRATETSTVPVGDKRHPLNGVRILRAYFAKFFDDPFEVMLGADGLPLVEKSFEFVMVDEPHVKIVYFGTVDAILKNTETGVVLVVDHKTTSSLGTEFYTRIKPNHQYTGYVAGASKAFGIDTELFMVNGLQVAKTKAECARQITTRTAEDYAELVSAVRFAVSDYLQCDSQDRWPQNAPNPCSMYGRCQFHDVCAAPAALRPQILTNLYGSQHGQTV